jgi:hypothetical protein
MKSVVFVPLLTVALVCFLALGAAAADRPYPAAGPYTPVPPDVDVAQFTYALGSLPLLPRRFQNHCGFYRGHFYCADHCAIDQSPTRCHIAVPARMNGCRTGNAGGGQAGSIHGFRVTAAARANRVMIDSLVAPDSLVTLD